MNLRFYQRADGTKVLQERTALKDTYYCDIGTGKYGVYEEDVWQDVPTVIAEDDPGLNPVRGEILFHDPALGEDTQNDPNFWRESNPGNSTHITIDDNPVYGYQAANSYSPTAKDQKFDCKNPAYGYHAYDCALSKKTEAPKKPRQWDVYSAAVGISLEPQFIHAAEAHKKCAPESARPREFWIDPLGKYHLPGELKSYTAWNKDVGECGIHVTEVPRGSRVISQEELEKAWDSGVRNGVDFYGTKNSPHFKKLLIMLGFA